LSKSEEIEVFEAFREFLQPARFKVAYGGRGSGKTRTFVTLLVTNVLHFGWRVVSFREIMKSIEDSIYQEIVEEISRRGLERYFNILKTEIQCPCSGGIFKFDGLYRNQQKVKGYAGFDCAFVEEAANVSEESWKFLIPTIRKPGSELWCCFNPESPLDDTYKRFVSERIYPDYMDGKRYCIVKRINYDANPRFPAELRYDMELMRDADQDLYRHVYLGEPVANSDLAVINPRWIAAAIDLHKHLNLPASGGKRTAFDVADEGPDANAIIGRHGWVVNLAHEWRDNDPNSAANKAWELTLDYGSTELVFDSIGVGAGAKGELRQRVADYECSARVTPAITAFNAASAVRDPEDVYQHGKTNKETFSNLKAQTWWYLRDRFYNAYKCREGMDHDADMLISLDALELSERVLAKLCAELAQPRREYLNGKIKIESKEHMRKRGVKSPNLADALVMAFAPEEVSMFDMFI